MSSAFSVRDIRNIRQLAWATWRKCKGSSDQFRCVSREVLTLYTTIIEVEDDANDCASVLTRKGAGRNEELLAIVRGCEVTLNQLQELLESPNTVGANNNKSSDGIEFKNGVVDNMRGKLLYHSLTIGLFVTSLDPQALSRLGERIDDFAGKVRRGNKEDSAAAPYEDECEDVWELLKREVIEAGVSKDSVKRYKEDVKSCLKELISKDGKDEGTQNSPSVVESANTK
ncbi:MAG: hypothetical protein M1837_007560 [Sclerophora amabilis]|nr:MAG: hypothetical protein M1837_007560 [Sclerophora amabilis]